MNGIVVLMITKKQEGQERARLSLAHFDYAKRLNAHAFFKVNDHAMGEDLVQTTFMKTWKYLLKGGKVDVMKAFLYHILNNLIVDEYRKRKTTSLDVLVEKGYEPGDEGAPDMQSMLDGKAAMLLIKHLPEIYRKVIRMRYVQHLSLKEMALITGETTNTMGVRIHRGLKKLKVLYTAGV